MIEQRRDIAILGGGLSGLICAYRLIRKGARVTVLEESEEPGGRAGSFEFQGRRIDRFAHEARGRDGELIELLRELELDGGLDWEPAALPGLGSLGPLARARAAWGSLLLRHVKGEPKGLGRKAAIDWLREVFGAGMARKVWEPLLRARFGEGFGEVPARWAWHAVRPGTRTAFDAGRLASRLEAEIVRGGGTVLRDTPVVALRDEGDAVGVFAGGRWKSFDAAVAAIAPPLLREVADGSLLSLLPRRDLDYRGVVTAVAVLNQPLRAKPGVDPARAGGPFQSVEERGDVVYLTAYCDLAGDGWAQVDAAFEFQALKALRALNPQCSREWVEELRIFRSAHAQPVWSRDGHAARPRMRCGTTWLYLATEAQCGHRPDDWNALAGLATDIAGRVEFDLRHAAAPVGSAK